MTLLRQATRIHKWIALIVGLQILLWIAGGVVMSAIPIEIVRGEHKIAERADPNLTPETLIPLAQIADQLNTGPLQSAELTTVLGKPAWRIVTGSETTTVDAQTGEPLSPVTEKLARQIALADYNGTASIEHVDRLTDPPAEYGRPGPVWQVRFDDGDRTTLYVDPHTTEIRARRSRTWRFYDAFWKLHVMDYDDGADFNHPLLITAAGAALFVALSGLVLLVVKVRRSIRLWQRQQSGT